MSETPLPGLDHELLAELLVRQHGVVSRKQLVQLGALPHEIARMVRRRELVAVHRGVAWWRTARPDSTRRVVWVNSPPRIRIEHAAIDVAATHHRDPVAMFRTLADVCQTRRTTARRIGDVLCDRGRVAERLHGLPQGNRQKPATIAGKSAHRDVDYEEFGMLVELDGRAFHDDALSWDLDALRDLDTLVDSDRPTVRLTYGLVFGTPCQTVAKIGALLSRRGWTGTIRPCPACPGAP